jgi:predicted nucleic acid-binding protein
MGEKVAIEKCKMLISFPNLTFLDMTQNTINEAQKMCESYHLDPRDAIHSACAISSCGGKIFSRDGDFDSVNGIHRIFTNYQKAT